MPVQTKLIHEPLDTIRLLRLPWGKDESKFDGHLVPFSLITCPDFVALSYTWGIAIHPEPININGHDFQVLKSLHSLLRLVPSLSEFSSDTWWWIDSICINQRDEEEKSSQMEIMGKIYQTATKTVVWLGEEIDANFGEDSRDCRNAISNLYRLCREMDDAFQENRSSNRAAIRRLRDPQRGLDWKAVQRLLLRPWWRRVWTLQEFLLSHRENLKFYCGSQSISRRNLEDGIYVAYICKAWDAHLLGRQAYQAGWNRRRMSQWYKKRKQDIGLVASLAYVGDSEVSHAEDRIYSLLGIARDAHMIRHVDAKASVEDVYTELVKAFINPKNYGNLDIICYSHLFNYDARKSSESKMLPSWVPDWRAHVEGKVVPVMASQPSSAGTGNFRPTWVHKPNATYKAAGHKIPQITVSEDNKILICTGIMIDKIDGLGGSRYNDAGEIIASQAKLHLEQTSDHSNNPNVATTRTTPTSILMETISRCLALDRKDRYLAETMTLDFYLQDFLKFCKAYFENSSGESIPTFFREWFDVNKSLITQGQTLEEHAREATMDIPTPKAKELKEGSLKKFYMRLEDTVVTMARRFTVTEKGHLGMAASRARKGDLICVLYGCSIPVLLREQDYQMFELIGECYLDDFMSGEALDEKLGFVEGNFSII